MVEDMNLKSLNIFLKTAELKSFSAASRNLGLTPAAVSKSVGELEKAVGTRLFHRNTRVLSLTEDGKRLQLEMTPALERLEEALNRTQFTETDPTGNLKINIPESFGKKFILPLLPEFLASYPGLTLDLHLQDKKIDPIQEGFDINIGNMANADSSLIARDLCKIQLLTLASPEYLAGRPRPEKPEDLSDHHLIAYRQLSTGRVVDWRYKTQGGSISITPSGRLTLSNIEAVAECVKAGLGIGCVGHWHVKKALAEGQLVELLHPYRPAPMDVKIYFSSRAHQAKKVRVLIDFLLHKANSHYFE